MKVLQLMVKYNLQWTVSACRVCSGEAEPADQVVCSIDSKAKNKENQRFL